MIFKTLFFVLLIICSKAFSFEVPYTVLQGDTILLKKDIAHPEFKLTAEFLGKKYEFFEEMGEHLTFIGIDYNQRLGVYNLIVRSGYRVVDIKPVLITFGNFPDEVLKVNKRFTHFTPKIIRRIRAEKKKIVRIYNKKPLEKIFRGNFKMPVAKLSTTSQFGTRRVYNNYLAGRHGGWDLRAWYGTPIKVINHGIVEYAAYHYLPGRIIVINHGMGIFSLYMHLAKILVKPGDFVTKGDIIGEAGATGRVTGPHLDIRVKIQKATVSPEDFINLYKVR